MIHTDVLIFFLQRITACLYNEPHCTENSSEGYNNIFIMEMSSNTEIYIKTEMDDSQDINIENIEQFKKS